MAGKGENVTLKLCSKGSYFANKLSVDKGNDTNQSIGIPVSYQVHAELC